MDANNKWNLQMKCTTDNIYISHKESARYCGRVEIKTSSEINCRHPEVGKQHNADTT